MVWEIAIAAVNEGDDPDIAPSFTAVTDAIVTAERDQLTPATAAIPISGTLTADSRLQIWIRRNSVATGDTMSGADASCSPLTCCLPWSDAIHPRDR